MTTRKSTPKPAATNKARAAQQPAPVKPAAAKKAAKPAAAKKVAKPAAAKKAAKPAAKQPAAAAKARAAAKPAAKSKAAAAAKPAGLRLGASLSAMEIYLNRMPGPAGGARPPVTLRATLEVSNQSREPVAFTFPSTQRFEIEVVDRRGRVLTTWSQNKRFAAALGKDVLAAGKSWTFTGEVQIGDAPERKLTLGAYAVRIYLTGDHNVRAILPVTISAAY